MKAVYRVSERARTALAEDFELQIPEAIEQVLDQNFQDRQTQFSGELELTESEIRSQVTARLGGNGILQPYLDDDSIEEIYINRPDELFIVRRNDSSNPQRISCNLSSAELRTICLNLLRLAGRRVDALSPFADASLPDGSRLHVAIPDITRQHISLNIRKFPKRQLTLNSLVIAAALSQEQALQLKTALLDGMNVLISGATHTGKTTMLSALLNELPLNERLVTCEETFELNTELQDWVALQTRQPNIEGQGGVPLRRLVKEALRMRPERLVVGEVREAESFDLLIAMNSGIPGLCTIHANSAKNAVSKLSTLALLAAPNISEKFVSELVAECIDFVVHLGFSAGERRVLEVTPISKRAQFWRLQQVNS